jgi:5-formyltetrahydrofolate cyclo-ligase
MTADSISSDRGASLSHDAAPDKQALRRQLRQRRADFCACAEFRCDGLIATLFVADRVEAHLGDAKIVSGYLSDGQEVDPLPILLQAIDRGLTTALPRVTAKDAPMRFHHWLPGDELVPGPFGLLQPREDAPALHPDLILTPLVGFDRALNRLGQGAGFYDRVFAASPEARRIGLAWSVQEVPAIPTDPWDVPLHGVATEKEWIGA